MSSLKYKQTQYELIYLYDTGVTVLSGNGCERRHGTCNEFFYPDFDQGEKNSSFRVTCIICFFVRIFTLVDIARTY